MFKIASNPTFKHEVSIKRADGEVGKITFEFRHKRTDEMNDFLSRAENMKSAEWAKEIVVGWEGVDRAFDDEALAELLQNHLSAAEAIFDGYLKGLSGGRLGN